MTNQNSNVDSKKENNEKDEVMSDDDLKNISKQLTEEDLDGVSAAFLPGEAGVAP